MGDEEGKMGPWSATTISPVTMESTEWRFPETQYPFMELQVGSRHCNPNKGRTK